MVKVADRHNVHEHFSNKASLAEVREVCVGALGRFESTTNAHFKDTYSTGQEGTFTLYATSIV